MQTAQMAPAVPAAIANAAPAANAAKGLIGALPLSVMLMLMLVMLLVTVIGPRNSVESPCTNRELRLLLEPPVTTCPPDTLPRALRVDTEFALPTDTPIDDESCALLF